MVTQPGGPKENNGDPDIDRNELTQALRNDRGIQRLAELIADAKSPAERDALIYRLKDKYGFLAQLNGQNWRDIVPDFMKDKREKPLKDEGAEEVQEE